MTLVMPTGYTYNSALAIQATDWIGTMPHIDFVNPTSIHQSTLANPCVQETITIFNPYGTTQSIGAQTLNACVHLAKNFQIARINQCVPNNSGGCTYKTWMVYSKANSSKFYRVEGLYPGVSDDCWQTSQNFDSIYYVCDRVLFWVKDLQAAAVLIQNTQEEFYEFDNLSGYEYFRDDTGNLVEQNGVNISYDGKWALVAIKNVGIAKIDIATKHVKLFTKQVQLTGYGFDPHYDLSVDKNGRYVAVGGRNAGAFVYDTLGSCGSYSDSVLYSWRDRQAEFNECPVKNLVPDIVQASDNSDAGFKEISNIYMSPESTYITGVYSPMRLVDGAKTGAVKITIAPLRQEFKYIALGDSYSSGEGDIPIQGMSFYTPETDYPGGCHLSTRSYPYRLTDILQINTDTMRSVACSGAKLEDDVLAPFDGYMGQNSRLKGKTADEVIKQKADALTNFTPGIAPQVEFVKKYKPSFITITATGNDVGFADILKYCAGEMYTCDYAKQNSVLHSTLLGSIKMQKDRIAKLITQIKLHSPNTAIYILAYPEFIADSPNCQRSVGLLNSKEKRMIIEGVALLNQTIKSAIAQEGAHYVDVQDALRGGRLCEGTHEYVSGLDNLTGGFTNTTTDRNQTFHPNSAGHDKIAQAVIRAYPDIAARSENPERSSALIDAPLDRKKLPIAERSLNTLYAKTTRKLLIQAPAGSFKPNSDAKVLIYSHEHDLGKVKVAADGSFSKTFDLPRYFEKGDHVIVAKGKSLSDSVKYLYEFVTIDAIHKFNTHAKCIEHSVNFKKFNCQHEKYR